MSLNCHNNLEVSGSWENLKKFFINNSTDKCVLYIGNISEIDDKFYMVDWDRELFEEKMEQISYVFMTEEYPPEDWLEEVANKNRDLEFNLVYQNREKDSNGEIVYKNGDLYCNYKSDEEESNEKFLECGY